ncbi:hypothetical protein PSACC_02791 [Paramicrosporidium saccamoebae]|uniref:Uncharacterized protein n=1 Tax=Paramicrosporidium saccamoebae TaxID=1246581 RepID=A0A2H9TI30_9FUNG|nr:hypothetical protein PSACC_02791 [Paramicrosporidium saccamoebae]
MAITKQSSDQQENASPVLLSLDRNGEVALWSIDDGRCLLHNMMAIDGEARGLHLSPRGEYAFIYGHTSFVNVVRVSTLEVVQSVPLPNLAWIGCMAVLEEREGTVEFVMLPVTAGPPIAFVFDENLSKVVSLAPITSDPADKCVSACCRVGQAVWCLSENSVVAIVRKNEGSSSRSRSESGAESGSGSGSGVETAQLIAPILDDKIVKLLPIDEQFVAIYLGSDAVIMYNLKDSSSTRHELPIIDKLRFTRRILSWKGKVLVMDLATNMVQMHNISESVQVKSKMIENVEGVTCSLIVDRGGPRAINGLENGTIQIVALFDAFLAFSGVLNDRVILEGHHSNEITHLSVIGDRLLSGDCRGVLNIWDLNGKVHVRKLTHHFAAIVASFCVSDCRLLVIDQKGRASVVDLETLKFAGFLGTRHVPLLAIKWTTEGDLRVCLVYQDGRIQIWNLMVGNCEKECSSSFLGLDELLQPFKCHHEVHSRFVTGDFLLSTALSWRHPRGVVDPVQVAVIDIRKLLEGIKGMMTKNPDEGQLRQIRFAISFVVSLLLPSEVDEEVDSWAHRLGHGHGRRDVMVGLVGANGNVAIRAPLRDSGWKFSGTISATYYLALAALFELSIDFGEDWDRLRMAFSSRLLESALSADKFPLPSFSYASKYWHDLGEEIRHGSRLLIVQTLARMDEAMLGRVVDYWSTLLLANENNEGRKMNRAAIILGIVAVHRPELLTDNARKMVADSLMSLLMDEKRNLFRAAAIELIGKAYSVWEGHVHALSVFRLLLGWLAGMSQIDESGPVAQLVVPFESAATLDTLDSVRGTLLKLAAAVPQEILPLWLGQDFVAARTTIEKWTTISLLSDLVRQRPHVLRSHVTLAAETACRLVEGGSMVGHTKTRLLAIAMPLVNDLVSSFPTAAYHRDTFRLAAADQGMIRLYDLRGSASVRSFEGHTQPVTALSFSRDGRFLLSYSWGEATLRWWQVPSGLIGFLGGAVRPWHTEVVDPALTTALQQHMEEAEGNEMITFNWNFTDVQIAVAGTVVAVVKIPTN